MAPRHPGSLWKPLPEAGKEPGNQPRLLILHTIVGSANGAFNYFRDTVSLESHFIVPKVGPPWQIMETTDTADCNYRANSFSLSVETEDNGIPATDPWNDNQLAWLIDIGVWACRTFPAIEARRADSSYGSGIGYHSMWGAPSDWTPVAGKTCPGTIRIQQFNDVVLPGILDALAPVHYSKGGMRQGDRGPLVRVWQAQLNTVNAPNPAYVPLTTDGIFGAKTHAATVEFQRWCNDFLRKPAGLPLLGCRGIVGPRTVAHMNWLLGFGA